MPGPDDMIEQDKQQIASAYQQYKNGGFSSTIADLLEQALWGLSFLSIVLMMAALPFVGPDGVVSGTLWIGLSTTCIVAFGMCAGLVRLIKGAFDDADRAMSNKFERGR